MRSRVILVLMHLWEILRMVTLDRLPVGVPWVFGRFRVVWWGVNRVFWRWGGDSEGFQMGPVTILAGG
jgi:hypothetical protein